MKAVEAARVTIIPNAILPPEIDFLGSGKHMHGTIFAVFNNSGFNSFLGNSRGKQRPFDLSTKHSFYPLLHF
jgi:hypothetical protein